MWHKNSLLTCMFSRQIWVSSVRMSSEYYINTETVLCVVLGRLIARFKLYSHHEVWIRNLTSSLHSLFRFRKHVLYNESIYFKTGLFIVLVLKCFFFFSTFIGDKLHKDITTCTPFLIHRFLGLKMWHAVPECGPVLLVLARCWIATGYRYWEQNKE